MILEPLQPIESHARLIMEWRNDTLTRAMSFHQDLKIWPEFWREFVTGYFPKDVPPTVFGMLEGVTIGLVSFRPAAVMPDSCEISVMIAPDQRDQGFGKALVQLGTDYAHQYGVKKILAQVKPDNKASLRLFTHARYQNVGLYPVTIDDLAESVTVYQFLHHQRD